MAVTAHDPPAGERPVPEAGGADRPARAFSDGVLRAIRERVDLVEFIGAYVSLRRTGQNAVGLCPFHSEKRPSFTVSAAKQLYHCFGCGAGGDLFAFVMQRESISFPEAVQWLARKAGVTLPSRESSAGDRRRQALYDIHAAAAEHFRRRLAGREGEAARRYLQSRRLTPDTLDAFGLGYASASWDDLLTALTAKRWTPAQIQDAGLVVPRSQGGGWYDRFRNRVICPIHDAHGFVIAFGGRVLDDALPKYLNSPDTPIFAKGRCLFAIDRARDAIAATRTLVVVEGYFDVIAAHQAGFKHVVATLGTALTPYHFETVRRLVSRLVLVFDPDEAGVRAALRAVDVLGSLEVRIDAAQLPGGLDPDALIHRQGPEAFQEAIDHAVTLVEFALERLVPPGDYRGTEQKIAAVERARPVLAKLSNAIARDRYVAWLADRIRVSESTLREELQRGRKSPPEGGSVKATGVRPTRAPARPWPHAEEVVAAALIQGRLASGLLTEVSDDAMTDATLRAVVEMARAEIRSQGDDLAIRLRDRAVAEGRDDVANALAKLATYPFVGDEPDQAIYDCVVRLRSDQYRRRMEDLPRAIAQCQQEEQKEGLQRELDRLKKAMMEIEQRRGARVDVPKVVGG